MTAGLLLVSFGTTVSTAREALVTATTAAYHKAFPERVIAHAFTSTIVRRRVFEQTGIQLDDVRDAVMKLHEAGVTDLAVQSLHVIPGIEFEQLKQALAPLEPSFSRVVVGQPLLTSFADYQVVTNWLGQLSDDGEPMSGVVMMGHGTEHQAFTAYACLDHMLQTTKTYMGAVESYPGLEQVINALKRDHVTTVTLRPFMMVAGHHVAEDMLGEMPASWRSQLTAAGIHVTPLTTGLATEPVILEQFIAHTRRALEVAHD
ncbi:sirohydrochlorin cobaltochelatase [Furfurilactobacillus sp. WILCCON 0119]